MDLETIFNLINIGILLLLPIVIMTLWIMRQAYLRGIAYEECKAYHKRRHIEFNNAYWRSRGLPNATYLTRLVK